MLDIKFIREHKSIVQKAAKDKQMELDIDHLLDVDAKRVSLLQEVEKLRMQRNEVASQMKSERNDDLIEKGKKIKQQLQEEEQKLQSLEVEYKELMYLVPQIPSEDTPLGADESGNVEIKTWGDKPEFDFEAKDHMALAQDLGIVDFERGVKVHGFRGYFLKHELTMLHMGVLMHSLTLMKNKGFIPMVNPVLVKQFALQGSGHFPFGKEEVFQVANPGKLEDGSESKDPLFLAGTAEPSLLAYFSNELLDFKNGPVKVCGISPCFRSEVGSYGKDTKGLYRIHEFMKVEQVILCENDYEISMKYFDEMKEISEELLQSMQLPYRIIQTCTGDMGAGKYRMDDIETWMPGREKYGETHSCSNLGDWQSRRLNIKYIDDAGSKQYAHGLNNTVVASPRILIAILENFQQSDGSIKVPDVLQSYVGTDTITSHD